MLSIFLTEITGHKDLRMIIPSIGVEQYADTYYFTLDNSFMLYEESSQKTLAVLEILFNYWRKCLKNIAPNEIVYLPFDFSDQYIGCLKLVGLKSGDILLCYGYTEMLHGYSFPPSQPELFVITEEQFISDGNFDNCTKAELSMDLDSIMLSIF